MKTSNGAFFYRCDAFNSLIKWKAGSEYFVVVNRSRESSYLETVPNSQVTETTLVVTGLTWLKQKSISNYIARISDKSRTLFRVSCQRLGTFKLLLKRGNLVGDDYRLASVAEAWLPVICSIPFSIVLIADEPVNEYEVIRASAQAERSSRRLRDNPITVANGRTIRISAAGISASG
ncbi:hypothetical protein P8452_49995 [Trifolium repens]|nr:hypothetical protein P8452_49995 [Trifolium repens]